MMILGGIAVKPQLGTAHRAEAASGYTDFRRAWIFDKCRLEDEERVAELAEKLAKLDHDRLA